MHSGILYKGFRYCHLSVLRCILNIFIGNWDHISCFIGDCPLYCALRFVYLYVFMNLLQKRQNWIVLNSIVNAMVGVNRIYPTRDSGLRLAVVYMIMNVPLGSKKS